MVILGSRDEDWAAYVSAHRVDFLMEAKKFIEELPFKPRPDSAHALNEMAFNRLAELFDDKFVEYLYPLDPKDDLSRATLNTRAQGVSLERGEQITVPILRLYATLQSVVPALQFQLQTDLEALAIHPNTGVVTKAPEESRRTALQELLTSDNHVQIHAVSEALLFLFDATRVLHERCSLSSEPAQSDETSLKTSEVSAGGEVRHAALVYAIGVLRDLFIAKKESKDFDPLSASISHINRQRSES